MGGKPAFEITRNGVVLELGEFCIQTAAKRAHEELASALLDGRTAGREAETAFEILARVLSTTDFAALRTARPELAGGTACRVELHTLADGVVHLDPERSA